MRFRNAQAMVILGVVLEVTLVLVRVGVMLEAILVRLQEVPVQVAAACFKVIPVTGRVSGGESSSIFSSRGDTVEVEDHRCHSMPVEFPSRRFVHL